MTPTQGGYATTSSGESASELRTLTAAPRRIRRALTAATAGALALLGAAGAYLAMTGADQRDLEALGGTSRDPPDRHRRRGAAARRTRPARPRPPRHRLTTATCCQCCPDGWPLRRATAATEIPPRPKPLDRPRGRRAGRIRHPACPLTARAVRATKAAMRLGGSEAEATHRNAFRQPSQAATDTAKAVWSLRVTSAVAGSRSSTKRTGMNASACRTCTWAPKWRADAATTSGSTMAELSTWLR